MQTPSPFFIVSRVRPSDDVARARWRRPYGDWCMEELQLWALKRVLADEELVNSS